MSKPLAWKWKILKKVQFTIIYYHSVWSNILIKNSSLRFSPKRKSARKSEPKNLKIDNFSDDHLHIPALIPDDRRFEYAAISDVIKSHFIFYNKKILGTTMLLCSFRRKRQHQAFGIGTYQTEHKNILMDTFIKK